MSSSSWFAQVFGFPEPSQYQDVRARFDVLDKGGEITLVTKPPLPYEYTAQVRRFHVGMFETPSVKELRNRLDYNSSSSSSSNNTNGDLACSALGSLTFTHAVGEAGNLHRQAENAGAVFQAASQFNCLEMTSPNVTPEHGITRYANDHTQGPACALACPAATLFRNYFVNTHGQGGQNGKQLDTMQEVGEILGNDQHGYWKMKNGYLLPTRRASMLELAHYMKSDSAAHFLSEARDALRVGVHWDTEVSTNDENGSAMHNVTQVYCSAIPVGYSLSPDEHFQPLAQLVLDGLYEATLGVAAVLAQQRQARVRVYLTMVGGGVFRNQDEWIARAIHRALNIYRNYPLDVALVHYGYISEYYEEALPPIT